MTEEWLRRVNEAARQALLTRPAYEGRLGSAFINGFRAGARYEAERCPTCGQPTDGIDRTTP